MLSLGVTRTLHQYFRCGLFDLEKVGARDRDDHGFCASSDDTHGLASGSCRLLGRVIPAPPTREKISAEEVENLLYRVPGIAQAAAVAVPDPDLGERVCAVIVPAGSQAPALEDIRAAFTAMEVARYKIPEHLLTVAELPLTKVSKIDKKALREIARDALDRADVTGIPLGGFGGALQISVMRLDPDACD